jgi:uncharacterized protein
LKLHLDGAAGQFVFTSYGDGYVAVNGEPYRRSLVVLPERLIDDWPATTFAALEAEHLVPLATLGIEILLLGTGKRIRFPRPEVTRPLIDARIGVEVMDTQAACRTYNILLGEGRKVAAALLFD